MPDYFWLYIAITFILGLSSGWLVFYFSMVAYYATIRKYPPESKD